MEDCNHAGCRSCKYIKATAMPGSTRLMELLFYLQTVEVPYLCPICNTKCCHNTRVMPAPQSHHLLHFKINGRAANLCLPCTLNMIKREPSVETSKYRLQGESARCLAEKDTCSSPIAFMLILEFSCTSCSSSYGHCHMPSTSTNDTNLAYKTILCVNFIVAILSSR